MPGVTVLAPLYGILSVMHGSAYMLKVYSTMNVMAVWFNYPLTLIPMLYLRQPLFYILLLVALIVNKVILAVLGSKVRSLLHNPDFELNKHKLSIELEALKHKVVKYIPEKQSNQ